LRASTAAPTLRQGWNLVATAVRPTASSTAATECMLPVPGRSRASAAAPRLGRGRGRGAKAVPSLGCDAAATASAAALGSSRAHTGPRCRPAKPRQATAAAALACTLVCASVESPPARAAAEMAMASLDACVARVFTSAEGPRLGATLDLDAYCPGLAEALRAGAGAGGSPRLTWAAAALSGDLSAAELLDLAALAAPPETTSDLVWSASQAKLAAILEEVLVTDDQGKGLDWWDRFLAWLRDLVKAQDDADLDWLEQLLASIDLSQETIDRILLVVLGLVVLAFVLLLVQELRAAGYFRGRRPIAVRHGAPPGPRTPAPTPGLSPSAIRGLSRQHQPAALLTLCIRNLATRGRLPADESRTNRELLRALAPDTAAPFAELVGLAEAASYGGYPVTDQVLARCFDGAGRILDAP